MYGFDYFFIFANFLEAFFRPACGTLVLWEIPVRTLIKKRRKHQNRIIKSQRRGFLGIKGPRFFMELRMKMIKAFVRPEKSGGSP